MDISVEVVVVERRKEPREIIQQEFARKGSDIHVEVVDGPEGVIAALSRRHLPCVVLIGDLDRDGRDQLLRHIKQSGTAVRRVPVVCWARSPDDVQCAYDLGVNSCVNMPEDPRHLAERMAEIAHYWVRHNVFYNQNVGGTALRPDAS